MPKHAPNAAGQRPPKRSNPTTRGFLAGAIFALVAFSAILLFVSKRSEVPPETPAPLRAATDPSTPIAPDFTVVDLDGKVFRLSDLRGQPIVVNFWATWCPPCRAEIPTFIELQQKYGPQGLRIVGIAMDEEGRDIVVPFVKANGINYLVALQNPDVVQRYGGVENLPTTFYIGRDGRIVQTVTGLISPARIEDNVREVLATSM